MNWTGLTLVDADQQIEPGCSQKMVALNFSLDDSLEPGKKLLIMKKFNEHKGCIISSEDQR